MEIVGRDSVHEFHTVPPEASLPTHKATLAGLGDSSRLQLEVRRREVAERVAEELRLKLAAQPSLPRPPPLPTSLPPSRSAWAKLGYQAIGALVLLMGAGTAFLTLRNTAQEPRIDSTVTRVDVQETATNTVEKRVKALETYLVKLQKHSDCVDAERDSAIQRGTGHVIEGDHEVEWKPQNKPVYKLRVLWETPTWSVETACPEKPTPPQSSTKKPAAE